MRHTAVLSLIIPFAALCCFNQVRARHSRLHLNMDQTDLRYYFNVDNSSQVPVYDTVIPRYIEKSEYFPYDISRANWTPPAEVEFMLEVMQKRYKIRAIRNALLTAQQFDVIYFGNSRRNFTKTSVEKCLLNGHYLGKVVDMDVPSNNNLLNGAFSVHSDGVWGSFRLHGRWLRVKPLRRKIHKRSLNTKGKTDLRLHIVYQENDSHSTFLRNVTRRLHEFDASGNKRPRFTRRATRSVVSIYEGVHLNPILLSTKPDEDADTDLGSIQSLIPGKSTYYQTENSRSLDDAKVLPRQHVQKFARLDDISRQHVQKFSHAADDDPKQRYGNNLQLRPPKFRSHVQKFRSHVQKFSKPEFRQKAGSHTSNAMVEPKTNSDAMRAHVQKFGPTSLPKRLHVQKFPLRVQKERQPTTGTDERGRQHLVKFRQPSPDPHVRRRNHVQKFPNRERSLPKDVQNFPNHREDRVSTAFRRGEAIGRRHVQKFKNFQATTHSMQSSGKESDSKIFPSTKTDASSAELLPVKENNLPFVKTFHGSKSTPLQASVLLGVIVDYSLYSSMLRFGLVEEEQQLFYILSLYNEIQVFYKEPSLAEKIKLTLSLKSVGFMTEEQNDLGADPYVPKYFENLCQGPYNLDEYDHLQALTMLDLFDAPVKTNPISNTRSAIRLDTKIRKPPRRKNGPFLPNTSKDGQHAVNQNARDSVGMALLGSACNKAMHCSIVEMASFTPSLSAADELAHSMGANHEGANGCAAAENPSSFLLSPAGKQNGWTQFAQVPIISTCAIKEMATFLKGDGKCLLKDPSPPGEGLEFRKALNEILHRPLSAEEICKLRGGPLFLKTHKWKHPIITVEEGNIPGICQSLVCNGRDSSASTDEVISFVFGPAPTGTVCNPNGHLCYNFQCVDKASIPAFYDGERRTLVKVS
ncbi:uncharacterized protein LOC129586954 isoform X2 [Paramacrobiotus metropolitanus]|uniref:uncharacterized protein LOC129586954 isoform X2 n=1 Tax=Paramacrobiotus metropolitanus TaxID=2943436 RepID=UPI002445C48E|nr:uncharacterized protein LOC129586954 isoform X2 [Paramacrobiotus metropolitanus]